jgi:hypothetical protein
MKFKWGEKEEADGRQTPTENEINDVVKHANEIHQINSGKIDSIGEKIRMRCHDFDSLNFSYNKFTYITHMTELN